MKNTIYSFLLLFVILIVYFPIFNNDFLYYWDDQWVVMNHYTEGGFNIGNLWAILTEFYHGQYAPLNELLYLILYTLFGYDPFFFHSASLLIHFVNSLLVFKCLMMLFETKEMNTNKITEYYKEISFLTALLFAIHPFNVESVAWMSASKIIVYAFYYLVATYFFIKYIQKKKIIFLILTAIFFIFSFLGKEQAVTFSAWMLLIYWILGYSFKDKKIWITTLPFICLSLLGGFVTMLSQSVSGGGALSDAPSYHLWQRFVYACYTFCEYLFKCIFPFKLSYLYPFPSLIGDSLPMWLLIYPTLVIVSIATFLKYLLSNKILSCSLIFFFIHIAVTLHIIPLSRFAVVADRYVYVSSIGICFALSYLTIYLIKKFKTRGKIVIFTVLCCYVLYFGAYSNNRCRVWHNSDTLKKEIKELLKQRDDYVEEIYY